VSGFALDRNFYETAWTQSGNAGRDFTGAFLNAWPPRGQQYDNGNFSVLKILLIFQVTVGGHEDFETLSLSQTE